MKTKKDASNQTWWWIAINGTSCAASPVDSKHVPTVVPTPEQLIGYRTQFEQLAAQRLILQAPEEKVKRYLESLPRRIQSGEVQYVRPDDPEPPTHGQTQWILSGGPSVQKDLPPQLQNSTTTPTLLSLIPREFIEPLKKLGNTDWLNIVTEPHGHRLELDESVLRTLEEHPRFCDVILRLAESMPMELLQLLAHSKILATGPKIVQPTPEQCEALAHVDLNLDFREYEQPFPAFVVELPIEIQRQLTRDYSVPCPRFAIPYHDRASHFLTVLCDHGRRESNEGICTVFSKHSLDETMESTLQKHSGEAGRDYEQAITIERIALNLSLLLTRYGFQENGPLDKKAFLKQSRLAKSKSQRKQQRANLLLNSSFQSVALSQNVQLVNKAETTAPIVGSEGSLKAPHWRRGHFRRVRVGAGRLETRLVFVRPSFINAQNFGGDFADTEYRIRTDKAVLTDASHDRISISNEVEV